MDRTAPAPATEGPLAVDAPTDHVIVDAATDHVAVDAPALQRRTGELPVEAPRAAGSVRWYSEEKGYGFIRPDDGGPDVFVRYSAIDGDGFRTLAAEQRVTYEPSSDGRGPRALAVRPATT